MKTNHLPLFTRLFSCLAFACLGRGAAGEVVSITPAVPQYRLFEAAVVNEREYANKFTDTELLVQYQAPSGRLVEFRGFFDGHGDGTGDPRSGNVWKMRFMPDEVGQWRFVYRWADGAPGGNGAFECVPEGAGRGILKAYRGNPRWFAYNGADPVWLKSYYETGHGSLGQDFDWIVEHVYQPLVDHGYNHLQVNWLMSLCCFEQYYLDGPEPETLDLALYEEGRPSSTMNLDVWRRKERHLAWLNDRDVGLHMFLGFDGSQNDGPAWKRLSHVEKDFYVRYAVARMAAFANIAGWNFVWEVPGDRVDHELEFTRLVMQYDAFDHLRTYQDEFPRENHYHLPEYTYAAVENHQIAAPDKELERHLWRSPWTHYMACILGYKGKPVFMSEGNALWRRYWQERTGATQDDLRRSAWACVTAGASFTWNGHASEYELYAGGPDGLPFNPENNYRQSESAMQIIAGVMSNEVEFFRMNPHDELLAGHSPLRVHALAEPGRQYLVFAPDGEPFSLRMQPGRYTLARWIDAVTGERLDAGPVDSAGPAEPLPFTPPNRLTDWILVVRAGPQP
jgi:hypothetical protein